ncbi:MAG TPA: Snf7 family protein [Candidatus Acidoferrum sp.]|nr:Snf7 family protein [Candidatus Acidoferrum sp.]
MSIVNRIVPHMHQAPLKEQIVKARSRLEIQKERLESMAIKIQQKDQELFERCTGAQVNNDLARAQVFANECAEVRKIYHIVLSGQLALEQVVFKLDMALEFGEVLDYMKPVAGIVAETKERLHNVVPHIATELGEINAMLEDLNDEAGPVLDDAVSVQATSEDAKKVLEESSVIAQERLSQTFPKLPEFTAEHNTASHEPLPAAGSEAEVDRRVYDYIKTHEGNLHVSDAARIIGIPSDRVKEALGRLESEGRVVVE